MKNSFRLNQTKTDLYVILVAKSEILVFRKIFFVLNRARIYRRVLPKIAKKRAFPWFSKNISDPALDIAKIIISPKNKAAKISLKILPISSIESPKKLNINFPNKALPLDVDQFSLYSPVIFWGKQCPHIFLKGASTAAGKGAVKTVFVNEYLGVLLL